MRVAQVALFTVAVAAAAVTSWARALHTSDSDVELERLYSRAVLDAFCEVWVPGCPLDQAEAQDLSRRSPAAFGEHAQRHTAGTADDWNLHRYDVYSHTNHIEQVPSHHFFQHNVEVHTPQSLAGNAAPKIEKKVISAKQVNKFAAMAVDTVGERKFRHASNSQWMALPKPIRDRLRSYPKPGSGFGRINGAKDPRDPVPDGHIAYHGVLHPTKGEINGKGLAHPNPHSKYPGPTRVIIHKAPKDRIWQVKVAYHDPRRPISAVGTSHPFSTAKANKHTAKVEPPTRPLTHAQQRKYPAKQAKKAAKQAAKQEVKAAWQHTHGRQVRPAKQTKSAVKHDKPSKHSAKSQRKVRHR